MSPSICAGQKRKKMTCLTIYHDEKKGVTQLGRALPAAPAGAG